MIRMTPKETLLIDDNMFIQNRRDPTSDQVLSQPPVSLQALRRLG